MVYIYVLRLSENKYYVGKTKYPFVRIDDHLNHKGSSWTNKYKPIGILKIFSNCDDFDEDKYTILMMNKHGINNVRGGSFSKIILNKQEIKLIKHMICGATDRCYKCYQANHFSKECRMNIFGKLKYKLNEYQYDIIEIDELILLLHQSSKIFINLTKSNIIGICNEINEKYINDDELIDINSINYSKFSQGLIFLLEDKPK